EHERHSSDLSSRFRLGQLPQEHSNKCTERAAVRWVHYRQLDHAYVDDLNSRVQAQQECIQASSASEVTSVLGSLYDFFPSTPYDKALKNCPFVVRISWKE
ncbi:hypothetical protein S245_016677, partial [Arachis hypogaea]